MRDGHLEEFQKQMDKNSTMHDFELSQFDLHGISKPPEEDPNKVEVALNDLDAEINEIKMTRLGHTYRAAERQSKAFVPISPFG
jgi:hypothetical protein